MKNSLKLAIATLIAGAALSASAYAQSTQDQIATCRAQIDQEQILDMEAYRLKFKSSKGSRTRTLNLEAIDSDGGARVPVVCKLSRGGKVTVALGK